MGINRACIAWATGEEVSERAHLPSGACLLRSPHLLWGCEAWPGLGLGVGGGLFKEAGLWILLIWSKVAYPHPSPAWVPRVQCSVRPQAVN